MRGGVAQGILRVCDGLAALALAVVIVIVTAVALSRYLLGETPIWTEPVVGILVFVAVCAAMPSGLLEGVHVSMRALGRLGERAERWREVLRKLLCFAFGAAITVSGLAYAQDMFQLGLTDYAGLPEGIPAAVGVLFGVTLSAYSAVELILAVRRLRRDG